MAKFTHRLNVMVKIWTHDEDDILPSLTRKIRQLYLDLEAIGKDYVSGGAINDDIGHLSYRVSRVNPRSPAPEETLKTMSVSHKGLKDLRKMKDIHLDGTGCKTDYDLGLYNGMELMLAMLENRAPYFIKRKVTEQIEVPSAEDGGHHSSPEPIGTVNSR